MQDAIGCKRGTVVDVVARLWMWWLRVDVVAQCGCGGSVCGCGGSVG
jgi:hypothetical protein